jgi:predicted DNA-binding ribbon-helix-helix protein
LNRGVQHFTRNLLRIVARPAFSWIEWNNYEMVVVLLHSAIPSPLPPPLWNANFELPFLTYFDASIPHSGLPITRLPGNGAGIPEKGLASKNKFLASGNKTPDLAFVLKSALPLAPRYAQNHAAQFQVAAWRPWSLSPPGSVFQPLSRWRSENWSGSEWEKIGTTRRRPSVAVIWKRQVHFMKVIKKWSVVVNGVKTSISLENEFWFAFDTVARAAGTSKGNVLTTLSEQHTNLSLSVRVAVPAYYVERAQMLETILRNTNT